MKEVDFVFLITSKKGNADLQEKALNHIIENTPKQYDYDIHIETRGNNWNIGFKYGLQYVVDNFKMKYGVFTFDDDNYLLPGSFDNMDSYLERFKHFQFREIDEKFRQYDYAVKIIRVPYFYLMLRNYFKKMNGFTVNPITTLRLNDKVTEPRKVLLCSPASSFIHHSLINLVIDKLVIDPSVVFYEALMLALHEFIDDIQPMIIPNAVLANRGTTKDSRYGFNEHLASNYYFGWYLFSHSRFVEMMEARGLLDLNFGFLRFTKFLLHKYLRGAR